MKTVYKFLTLFLCAALLTGAALATETDGTPTNILIGSYVDVTEEEPEIIVTDPYVPVEDIEIGAYNSQMSVGDTQYISASAVPSNATYGSISYASDDTGVLTVTEDGLVAAVSAGTAVIELSADGVSRSVTISVTGEAYIPVTDLDIAYESVMTEGTMQLIATTVYPENATDKSLSFHSSDPDILSVNSVGRVNALSSGSADITITAADIERVITITVPSTEMPEEEITEVGVSDIDIAEFTGMLAVKATQTINATVYPTDATEQKLTYYSSNTSVATVSAGGRITGVSKGSCTIYVSAGGVTKQLSLTVYVKTTGFDLNKTYVVLQPGKIQQLTVSAEPESASQSFTYSSTDTSVATVDETGCIKAVGLGSASVIVKNYDSEAIVSVVVNDEKKMSEDAESEVVVVDYNSDPDQLKTMIQSMEEGETLPINGDDLEEISPDILAALYANKSCLQVVRGDYEYLIDGAFLRNPSNTLYLSLELTQVDDGAEFDLNRLENMPGTVRITAKNPDWSYRYLYIQDDITGKYRRLDALEDGTMELDVAGHYLLTAHPYCSGSFRWWYAAGGVFLLLVCVGAYIAVKKKYWFW